MDFNLFFCIIVILTIFFVMKGIIIVPQQSVVIIEHLGEYSQTLKPGFHFIIPFFNSPRYFPKKNCKGGKNNKKWTYSPYIDLRETMFEYPLKGVMTKDGSDINIKISIYFQITDEKRAVYIVDNLYETIENATKETAQSMINVLCIDEIMAAKSELHKILYKRFYKWGVKVNNIIFSELSLSGY